MSMRSDQGSNAPVQPDWYSLERQAFEQTSCRIYPLLQIRFMGISLVRLLPSPDAEPQPENTEPPLFNAPSRQWRLKLALSAVRELVFDDCALAGVQERALPLLSRTNPDEFYGPMQVQRPTWMLIARGRYQVVAGRLSEYRDNLDAGQAHFTPLIELPTDDVEPPQIVQ